MLALPPPPPPAELVHVGWGGASADGVASSHSCLAGGDAFAGVPGATSGAENNIGCSSALCALAARSRHSEPVSWPAPSPPGQRPRSDHDIERFVGLMRLLAPFAPLAGLRQRSVFAARATREGDQHFGRQLPELVLAHPVW